MTVHLNILSPVCASPPFPQTVSCPESLPYRELHHDVARSCLTRTRGLRNRFTILPLTKNGPHGAMANLFDSPSVLPTGHHSIDPIPRSSVFQNTSHHRKQRRPLYISHLHGYAPLIPLQGSSKRSPSSKPISFVFSHHSLNRHKRLTRPSISRTLDLYIAHISRSYDGEQ